MGGKHTTGPWVLTGSAGIAVGTTEQESAVAVCVCQGTRTVGEAQANASLIAAAPDLLEACKEMIGTIWLKSPHGSDVINADAYKQMVAAIAKAEGRE